jgi:uncharacterized protein (TIGR00288 family)
MHQPNVEDIALFFDFENIFISLRKQGQTGPNFKKIMTWFSRFGRVVLARAYADWTAHKAFLMPLQANDFDPVFVTTRTSHRNGSIAVKNAVDMQIAVEATAVSYNRPNITTFGLLTGDKDYLPLVQHLRSRGKKVIVLAVQDCTSKDLRKAVDSFVSYRGMLAQLDGNVSQTNQLPAPIFEALLRAIKELEAEGKPLLLSSIKNQMEANMNGFNPKAFKRADGSHYGRFLSFVKEAQRLGLVQITKSEDTYTVQSTGAVQDGYFNGIWPSSDSPSAGVPLN